MNVLVDTITGVSVGCEYVEECGEQPKTLIIDIFIIRILFQWE